MTVPQTTAEGKGAHTPAASPLAMRIKDRVLMRKRMDDVAVIVDQELAGVREAMKALLPYLTTESEMLDDAALNEGRASGFGIASMKARAALADLEVSK